jgi:hypothetical protein
MLTTTSTYNSKIVATSRRTRGMVEVTWTDPYIDLSLSVAANDENHASQTSQAADLNRIVDKKWFHLNPSATLNGQFYVMPGTSVEIVNNQVGWWGKTESNSGTGSFAAPYPKLTITFTARPVYSLLVVGDKQYNEYPVDFTIKLYQDAVLAHTETVTSNALLEYTKYGLSVTNVTKMELEIIKWSAVSSVVKISEFYTSITQMYYGDDIISINLLEEREISDGSLPIGNISSNEIDIKIVNTGNEYFPDNTASDYWNLVKNNRKIRAWIGLETSSGVYEDIALGTFWSGDWDTPEMEAYISTSGRDRLEKLRKSIFATSDIYEDVNFYDLIEIVLLDAKTFYPDLVYSLDGGLTLFTAQYAWFERVSHFDAIKQIVSACMANAYMSRDDVLIINWPNYINPTL